MKKILRFFFSIYGFLLMSSAVFSQASIVSSGENLVGSGGSSSYSVGQVFNQNLTGINHLSVSQGVQQPFEILLISSLRAYENWDLIQAVYPNPTEEYLTLKVEESKRHRLTYQLINMEGKILESNHITSDESQLDFRSLPSATYFLKLKSGQKKIKTFQIIKK